MEAGGKAESKTFGSLLIRRALVVTPVIIPLAVQPVPAERDGIGDRGVYLCALETGCL